MQSFNSTRFLAACKEQCTQHVYAILAIVDERGPIIIGYGVSDWHDGATVASFTNGKRD